MVHGTTNVKFIEAKQAKEIYQYKTSKVNCIEQMQPYGTTKYGNAPMNVITV
jgi:hypothetical protein